MIHNISPNAKRNHTLHPVFIVDLSGSGIYNKMHHYGAVWMPEKDGSEEVGSRIVFFLENENFCFFSGVWMIVGKCN